MRCPPTGRRSSRRPWTRPSPSARKNTWRARRNSLICSRARASTSIRRTSTLSASTRRRNTWPLTLPRIGRPVWSTRSTRCDRRRGGRALTPALQALGAWCYRRAENILAVMLAVMFAAFIIQIVFRYLLNFPIGWTQELTVVLWIWLVLWGAAFVIRETEEGRFDIFYANAKSRTPRGVCL